jgi:hypothetical protein
MSTTIEHEPDTTVAKPAQESTGSALVLYKAMLPAQLFAEGAAMGLVEKIEAEVKTWKFDVTTEKGRKECASKSYSIRTTKEAIDKLGLQLTEGWRTSTARVNAERKAVEARLAALAESVRAPVTAWEQRDARRVQAHRDAINGINALVDYLDGITIEAVESRLATLHAMPPRDWEEFAEKASNAMGAAEEKLGDLLEQLNAAEAERVRLAKEAAAAQARREAEIAEAARKEAEARAHQEALEELRGLPDWPDREQLTVPEIERLNARMVVLRNREWGEFASEAQDAASTVMLRLADLYAAAERRAADAAAALELERVGNHKHALASLETIAKHDPDKDSPDTLRAKQAWLRRATAARNWEEFAGEAGAKSDELFDALEASIDAANERAAVAAAAANEARITAHRTALAEIPDLTAGAEAMSYAELLVMCRHLAALIQRPDRDWGEFGGDALAAYQRQHKRVEGLLAAALEREEAAAEEQRKQNDIAFKRKLLPTFAEIAEECQHGTAEVIRDGLSRISALLSYTDWGDLRNDAVLEANAARAILEPQLARVAALEAQTSPPLVRGMPKGSEAAADELAPTAALKRKVQLAIASALSEFKIPDAKAMAIAKAIEDGKIPHISVSYAEAKQP